MEEGGGSKKAENSEEKRDLKGLWDVSLGTAGGCFCLYLFPMSHVHPTMTRTLYSTAISYEILKLRVRNFPSPF